jgi:hypothetical protein
MLRSGSLDSTLSKRSNKAALAARVAASPAVCAQVLDGLSAPKASVKFGCAKVLQMVSEDNPRALYPNFARFVALLQNDNKLLQWTAIRVIANLARVDSKAKVERILDRYFAPIRGPVMITAANIIKGSAAIAAAKPHLTRRIIKQLLGVEKARYRTDECRNVALGHAIDAFDAFFRQIEARKPVLEFVRRQLANTRRATRRKAERFLKKHEQP